MLDLDRIIDQAPLFMGKTVYLLRRLKEAGEPITLSVNGRGNLSIKDERSYQLLLELVDRLETIESVKIGLKELDEGKGLSLEEAKQRFGMKNGVAS